MFLIANKIKFYNAYNLMNMFVADIVVDTITSKKSYNTFNY